MWEATYGWPTRPASLPQTEIPDPNGPREGHAKDAAWGERFAYWMRLADFYQWPYITYFDSWTHLFDLLSEVDLANISSKMRKFNRNERVRLLGEWKSVMAKVRRTRGLT